MANSTFIQLPMNVQDPVQLRRFLDKLVQQVDIAFGNRGLGGFTQLESLDEIIASINTNTSSIEVLTSRTTALAGYISDLEDGQAIITITTDLTLTGANSMVIGDCSLNDIVVTLPPPADVYTSGRTNTISVSKIDATSNTVTIEPNLAETLAGEANIVLLRESEVVNLVTDGTNWYLGA